MVTAKRRGDGYVLSGRKAYCAGGNVAAWLSVFATVSDDRSLEGVTGFALPTQTRGFHVSEVLSTMGLRACPLVEFYLENVYVPAEYLLTKEGVRLGSYRTSAPTVVVRGQPLPWGSPVALLSWRASIASCVSRAVARLCSTR